jgi:hypothetical protein
MKGLLTAASAVLTLVSTPSLAANLIVNGNFEASSNSTTTPPGWTNVGHSDGVIPYTIGSLADYDGKYFYDLGGYGDAAGPVNDGIEQTVATVAGKAYTLTFGLSSEDVSGDSQLTVHVGGQSKVYDLTSDNKYFGKNFTTQTIGYVATSTSTLISFIETENTSGGNNDPMIDKVIFGANGAGGTSGTPEPAAWAMLVAGFGMIGGALRSRRRASPLLA